MAYQLTVPHLGNGIREGEVLEWLVEPGQIVIPDEPVVRVWIEHIDVVVRSPVAGRVQELHVDAGQVVPVGTLLAEITTEAEGSPLQNGAAARGRVTRAATAPVVTHVDEADFEAVRASGYAPLPAVARAAVLALGGHPQLNAWRRPDGTSQEHEHVQLGIATHTGRGVAVPVIRDADRLTTDELADSITALTASVRMGVAGPEEFGGSTFTITTDGRMAGLFATPLLNLPEVAILGLYRVQERPVVHDGAVVARHVAHLSVSFDPRTVDGINAARFLSRVIGLVEAWPLAPAGSERAA